MESCETLHGGQTVETSHWVVDVNVIVVRNGNLTLINRFLPGTLKDQNHQFHIDDLIELCIWEICWYENMVNNLVICLYYIIFA